MTLPGTVEVGVRQRVGTGDLRLAAEWDWRTGQVRGKLQGSWPW